MSKPEREEIAVPKKGRATKALVKYGPLVYAAAQRYGPAVWEQVRQHREPVEKFAQSKVARATKGNQRKKAAAHARTLKDGNVLQVFHANEEHWVVFTGERPVAVHPATDTPYEVLLADADLSRRVYPTDAPVTIKVTRPHRAGGPRGRATGRPQRGTAAGSDTPPTDNTAGPQTPRALPEG